LDVEERVQLVVRNTEEVVTPAELRELLQENPHPHAYWGFECSGPMHIGMGLICGSKIKDMLKAGLKFTIFLADWHSWINNKFGGDMEKIRFAGEYFKHCFTALGVKGENLRFLWASELVDDVEYWEKVIRIAKAASLRRVMRALPIMGRTLGLSDFEAAWLVSPCMQAADIFHMKVDVACAGIDQRKVHMLARDVAEKQGWRKPICVHTHLLMNLRGPASRMEGTFDENEEVNFQIGTKMSKSLPQSAIFIHDQPEEIRNKVRGAYCPPREVRGNPVLELAKYVVFTHMSELEIRRSKEYGGSVTFHGYEELERAYVKGELHPLDLKNGVADALTEILEPVREYFKGREKIIERMLSMEVTR